MQLDSNFPSAAPGEETEEQKRRRVYKQARALKKLMEMPEWKEYIALIFAQAENWGSQSVAQSKSVDDMVAKEYPKGVLFGLRLAASIGPAIVAERGRLLHESGDLPEDDEDADSSPAQLNGAP